MTTTTSYSEITPDIFQGYATVMDNLGNVQKNLEANRISNNNNNYQISRQKLLEIFQSEWSNLTNSELVTKFIEDLNACPNLKSKRVYIRRVIIKDIIDLPEFQNDKEFLELYLNSDTEPFSSYADTMPTNTSNKFWIIAKFICDCLKTSKDTFLYHEYDSEFILKNMTDIHKCLILALNALHYTSGTIEFCNLFKPDETRSISQNFENWKFVKKHMDNFTFIQH